MQEAVARAKAIQAKHAKQVPHHETLPPRTRVGELAAVTFPSVQVRRPSGYHLEEERDSLEFRPDLKCRMDERGVLSVTPRN